MLFSRTTEVLPSRRYRGLRGGQQASINMELWEVSSSWEKESKAQTKKRVGANSSENSEIEFPSQREASGQKRGVRQVGASLASHVSSVAYSQCYVIPRAQGRLSA